MNDFFKIGFEKTAGAFSKTRKMISKAMSPVLGAASKATEKAAPGLSKKLNRASESAELIGQGRMPLSYKKDVIKSHRLERDKAITSGDKATYNKSSREYAKKSGKDMPIPNFKSPKSNPWKS